MVGIRTTMFLGAAVCMLAPGILTHGAAPTAGRAAEPQKRVIQPPNYRPSPAPLSPGILVGDTLYMSGSTGGDPVDHVERADGAEDSGDGPR
jgi:hypothetical protein